LFIDRQRCGFFVAAMKKNTLQMNTGKQNQYLLKKSDGQYTEQMRKLAGL
jgi:hypothetical protein